MSHYLFSLVFYVYYAVAFIGAIACGFALVLGGAVVGQMMADYGSRRPYLWCVGTYVVEIVIAAAIIAALYPR